MFIARSTLGMDATTTNKDVQYTESRVKLAARQQPDDEITFNIRDVGMASSIERLTLQSQRISTHSTVQNVDQQLLQQHSQERIVGQAVAEILNHEVAIRSMSPVSALRNAGNTQIGMGGAGTAGARQAGRMTLALESVSYHEETLALNTTGSVETADGRLINLGLDLEITQAQYIRESLDTGILASRFVDPLVLSFDDGLGVLESSRFTFDINGDGRCEDISCLSSGSGYLVLDRNGDGNVNNGLELFGPATGYGYAELGEYDSDGNKWIDENDPIFDKLQLWMGAGGEEEQLISLKDAGVGALALAHSEVDFDLMGTDGSVLGRIKSTGLFLSEAGEVRPMAEVDLATGEDEQRMDWPGLSLSTRDALRALKEMIDERNQRMDALVSMWREERAERQRKHLLDRLFSLRDEEFPVKR